MHAQRQRHGTNEVRFCIFTVSKNHQLCTGGKSIILLRGECPRKKKGLSIENNLNIERPTMHTHTHLKRKKYFLFLRKKNDGVIADPAKSKILNWKRQKWTDRSFFPSSGITRQVVVSRVARFFLVQNTKTGKIYQITTNYTKCP
jgi:hypothetical protein